MTNRRRKEEETYEEYRSAQKAEALVERIKLKGRWVWRSSMMIPNSIDSSNPAKLIKTPPYRKPKE